MSHEQDQENKLASKIEEMKIKIKLAAHDVLDDVYSDILPYILEDTMFNAKIQSEEIILKIIAGDFSFDGDYAVIDSPRNINPKIRIKFTASQYDRVRDAIIERMPTCPKDAKIKELEIRIKTIGEML